MVSVIEEVGQQDQVLPQLIFKVVVEVLAVLVILLLLLLVLMEVMLVVLEVEKMLDHFIQEQMFMLGAEQVDTLALMVVL